MRRHTNDNLRSFDAYRDENGQVAGGDPQERGRADDVHGRLMSEPAGDAELVRLASGLTADDATAATEAETPPENIAHISDPTITPKLAAVPAAPA